MKITHAFLEKQNACCAGLDWFDAQAETNAITISKKLVKEGRLDWANWLVVRVMTRPQHLAYAVFAAEQVIDIHERKYPDDRQPQKAIEAAKAVLKNDNVKNRKAAFYAANAAANVADAAFYAANAANAANAAFYAAFYAANAANIVNVAANAANIVNVAANAAFYAANAANAANAASVVSYTAKNKLRTKIIEYGIGLLEGKERTSGTERSE